MNVFYLVEHRLADGKQSRQRRVCFTQSAREGKFHFFSPQLDTSAGEKCTWSREVDSEETCTPQSEAHLDDSGAMHT